MGLGRLEVDNCVFDKTDISAGAGAVYISSSKLNNLDIEAGARKNGIRCRDYWK